MNKKVVKSIMLFKTKPIETHNKFMVYVFLTPTKL